MPLNFKDYLTNFFSFSLDNAFEGIAPFNMKTSLKMGAKLPTTQLNLRIIKINK